jgi:hypothetical protein
MAPSERRVTRIERNVALWFAMLDLGFALQIAGLRRQTTGNQVWNR